LLKMLYHCKRTLHQANRLWLNRNAVRIEKFSQNSITVNIRREQKIRRLNINCQQDVLTSNNTCQVALLRELKKEEFIAFFDQYIKLDAPQRRTLSVQVFSGNHSAEFKKAAAEADPPKTYRITDIFGFKRSRPLYSSLKGGPGRITMD